MTPLALTILREIQKSQTLKPLFERWDEVTEDDRTVLAKVRVPLGRIISFEDWQRRVECAALYRWLRRVKKEKKPVATRRLADLFGYRDTDTILIAIVDGRDSTLTFEAEALFVSPEFQEVLARFGFSN